MATVIARRQRPPTRPTANPSASGAAASAQPHPKMKIIPEGGDPFIVPYAPRETTTSGFAPSFSTVDRGGRVPLLLEGGQGLHEMSFELIVAFPNPNRSIESILKRLQKLAESGARMNVKLDETSGRFRWRLTSYSQQVLDRAHGTNDATRAVCSLAFTRASDPSTFAGPTSGGAKSGDCDKKDRPKFYVFAKGDTLQRIAKRFYCDSAKWRAIADANKIRDPKAIKVGTRLRLP